MIVCTNCSNHNEDDDEFCGSCGRFLEFVGERVAAPPPVVVEPEPEEERQLGLVERVKERSVWARTPTVWRNSSRLRKRRAV